jgi:poly(hydroxyalkanoate) depolymerase family esterase
MTVRFGTEALRRAILGIYGVHPRYRGIARLRAMTARRFTITRFRQRARELLRWLWQKRRQPPATSPSQWIAGVYREVPVAGRFGRRLQRELKHHFYLPQGRSGSEQLPLIVMLHGCAQDATQFAAATRMNAAAQERGCALLYPEQSTRANTLRCWNWFEPEVLKGSGEAGLVARLVQDVLRRQPVDPQRVYAVGMSAGAALAGILTVRYSALFAACALHSGVMYGAASGASEAVRALRSGASASPRETARELRQTLGDSMSVVPTLIIHGQADATVNPRNADQLVEQRLALADLLLPDGNPARPASERQLQSGGRNYRQRDYFRNSVLVVRSILIDELAHAWSGGDPGQRFSDGAGPDASRLILDFLLNYRARVAKSPGSFPPGLDLATRVG